MGARGRAHPSFGMTPTFREYDLWSQKTQILKSRCHTKRRMGGATRAHPSLGMTTTKTLRSVFSWHASQMFRALLSYVDKSIHHHKIVENFTQQLSFDFLRRYGSSCKRYHGNSNLAISHWHRLKKMLIPRGPFDLFTNYEMLKLAHFQYLFHHT